MRARRKRSPLEDVEQSQRAIALQQLGHVGSGGHDGRPDALDDRVQQTGLRRRSDEGQQARDSARIAQPLLVRSEVRGEQSQAKDGGLHLAGGEARRHAQRGRRRHERR